MSNLKCATFLRGVYRINQTMPSSIHNMPSSIHNMPSSIHNMPSFMHNMATSIHAQHACMPTLMPSCMLNIYQHILVVLPSCLHNLLTYMYNLPTCVHKILYSGKLLREKTFTNSTVLWLFMKVFSAKFGGMASFGTAKVSNLRKFSLQKS